MKYLVWYVIFFISKTAVGFDSGQLHAGFVENMGQITDQHGIPQSTALFVFHSNDFNIILKENSLSYYQYRVTQKLFSPESDLATNKSTAQTDVSLHRIDVRFIGANEKPLIIKENKLPYHINYQNVTPAVNHVSSFSKITYKNIYNNIDLVFYAANGMVKYDFVLYPGAALKDIQMQYNGANPVPGADVSIDLKTTDGILNEKIPLSYLLNTAEKVRVGYRIEDNIVSFKSSSYDKKQTLVIDPYPTITWNATFEHVNPYLSTTIDTHNNKILSAFCFADNIATTGAYQTTLQGAADAVVAKFDPDGILLWATYYGGENTEYPYSVCSDNLDNIILTGITKSIANISTPGSFQPAFRGGFDTFIATFTTDGILTWATYYGGSAGDTPYSVCTDTDNNILIIGQRGSTDFDFSTTGAFQETMVLTFLAKFSSSGNRLWGTYYGGSFTNGYKVSCSEDNAVYISGETADTGLSTTGVHQTQQAGNYDAFLTKFSAAGNRIWSTYFGGEGNEKMTYDQCFSFDHNSNIVLSGKTNSINQIATAGAYRKTPSGNDAFIAKFSDTGNVLWSTYFGGEGDDIGNSICVDAENNVILSGLTNSKTYISTPCVFQPNINLSSANAPASGYNTFIAKFDTVGNRIWGSYYGDNSYGQNAVQIDRSDKIILTGFYRTSPKDTAIAEYTVRFPFSGNAFLTSFDESVFPKTTITLSGKNPFCQGNSITLSSTAGEKYLWSTGAITQSIVAIHEGKYFLTLSDANGCAISSDTVNLHYIHPSIILNGPPKFCTGSSVQLTSTEALSYKWSTQETSKSITINRSGNYFVTVTDTSNTCISTSAVLHVDEIFPPVISFESKHDTICLGEEMQKSLLVSDATYLWSTGSLSNSITISSAGQYWAEVTRAPCPAVKADFELTVIPGIYYKIPNLITPNKDDKNDSFEIVHILPNTSLSVYNSWGSLVYKDADYKNNWEAAEVTSGIFYYYISNPSICVKDYTGWLEIRK